MPNRSSRVKKDDYPTEVLGQWATIQLEPIALSGEKITVGVVVQGDDGTVLSAQSLPKEVAIKVMGSYGEKLNSVSDMALRSLEHHVQQGGKFQDWKPVFSGATIGKVVRAGADNLEQLLHDALRRSAHYAAISKAHPMTKATREERWAEEVKRRVILNSPALKNNFHRQFLLARHARHTTVDFIGMRAAINFSVLSAKHRSLYGQINAAKVKLWDLEALRDHLATKAESEGSLCQMSPKNYELIVKRPQVNQDEQDFVTEALLELDTAAKRQEIIITPTSTPQEASRRLLEIELQ